MQARRERKACVYVLRLSVKRQSYLTYLTQNITQIISSAGPFTKIVAGDDTIEGAQEVEIISHIHVLPEIQVA